MTEDWFVYFGHGI